MIERITQVPVKESPVKQIKLMGKLANLQGYNYELKNIGRKKQERYLEK